MGNCDAPPSIDGGGPGGSGGAWVCGNSGGGRSDDGPLGGGPGGSGGGWALEWGWAEVGHVESVASGSPPRGSVDAFATAAIGRDTGGGGGMRTGCEDGDAPVLDGRTRSSSLPWANWHLRPYGH